MTKSHDMDNLSFLEQLDQLEENDKNHILSLPLNKVLPLVNENERDSVRHYFRMNSYVNRLDEQSSLNEGRAYEALSNLLIDRLPLVMKDKSFFQPHYRDLKSGKISIFEFISYFLQYLGEKKLAGQLGLDQPFMLASVGRTATNVIRKHLREV